MPSDVTMKDLQSLQGYVNRKIAELDGKLAKIEKSLGSVSADVDTVVDQANKNFETVKQDHRDQKAILQRHEKLIEANAKAIQSARVGP